MIKLNLNGILTHFLSISINKDNEKKGHFATLSLKPQ